MAHSQKPAFFFRRNGRVHLNRQAGLIELDTYAVVSRRRHCRGSRLVLICQEAAGPANEIDFLQIKDVETGVHTHALSDETAASFYQKDKRVM